MSGLVGDRSNFILTTLRFALSANSSVTVAQHGLIIINESYQSLNGSDTGSNPGPRNEEAI